MVSLHRRAWRCAIILVVAGWTALGAAGCRKTEPRRELFPVTGQVFFDKKPARGAVVWFHNIDVIDAKADPEVLAVEPRPRGVVREDGSFEVSTYGTNDGAPAGRYRLAIFWTRNTGKGDDGGENLLPLHYQDPSNSELPIIEIKSEPNVLPPLYLTP